MRKSMMAPDPQRHVCFFTCYSKTMGVNMLLYQPEVS